MVESIGQSSPGRQPRRKLSVPGVPFACSSWLSDVHHCVPARETNEDEEVLLRTEEEEEEYRFAFQPGPSEPRFYFNIYTVIPQNLFYSAPHLPGLHGEGGGGGGFPRIRTPGVNSFNNDIS